MKSIREAINEIEGMEYPEDESNLVANREINRIHYFVMEPNEFKEGDSLSLLGDIINQIMNPSVVFINHHHPYEKTTYDQTPGIIVTRFLG